MSPSRLERPVRPLRARRSAADRPRGAGLRIAVGVAAGGLLAFAAWSVWQRVQANGATIEFQCADVGRPALELTFFPDQLAFTAPSPPPAIGRLTLGEPTAVTVGRDLVPGQAVVRYAGPGIGTGFQHVRLGAAPRRIQLRRPQTLAGRVVEPVGAWCFGWRCVASLPVGEAEVVVMGGGEHGIELGRARTDGEGRFSIDGLDLAIDGLGLRVRAPGFAIAHAPLRSGRGECDVAVTRTSVRAGRVLVPPGVDATTLRLLARGLPGVEAVPAADGTFRLDHVPPELEPRLLVHGLPAALTHAPARASRSPVQIEVVPAAGVRGCVVDAATQARLAGALVFCGDEEAVRTDASGCFELSRLVPGPVEIRAQLDVVKDRRRTATRHGVRRVQLEPGKVVEDVVVPID